MFPLPYMRREKTSLPELLLWLRKRSKYYFTIFAFRFLPERVLFYEDRRICFNLYCVCKAQAVAGCLGRGLGTCLSTYSCVLLHKLTHHTKN